jgi:PBSX family phage terminase large subunit
MMTMRSNVGFQWKPFSDKQIQLLTWWMPDVSPFEDYNGVIAEGSIRSGKTIAMIDSFLMWSLSNFSGQNFILGGKTIGALKRNVLNPMFQILTSKGIPYRYIRSDDPRIEIGSNIYYIFGGDNERSQDKVQGLTAAGAYLDEVALMPRSFVDQVMGRCSVEGAKYFFNCNPGHPKHWLKTEYIDKAEEKKFLVLHFTMDDNLALSDSTKERLKSMFSGVFYLRNIEGLWVIAEGLVYEDFKEDVHKVSKKEIDDMLRRGDFHTFIGGVDWGYTSPMVGLVIGITRDKKAYIIDEFYKTKQTTEQLGEWFLQKEQELGKKMRAIFCDSAEPDRIMILKKMRLRAVPANKELNAGLNTCMTMFRNMQLFVSETCVNTINELMTYRYPEADDPKAKKDEPLDEDNHAMDSMRYALHTYFRRRG